MPRFYTIQFLRTTTISLFTKSSKTQKESKKELVIYGAELIHDFI